MEQSTDKAILSNGNTREELIARLPIPGPGRPKETEEKKLVKRAVKELVREYQESLADALPQISPVLISKAITGDVSAIKELHDRVMGKPPQKLEGDPENPLIQIVFDKAFEKKE